MPDEKDALQIKIDQARLQLPADTRAAIDAVDWRGVIAQIRNNEGYDFIQLAELETETELLLCGLANPEEYPRQIEKGMGISHEAAQKLVSEMNERVFKKIKEEMVKIAESKKVPEQKTAPRPVVVEENPIKPMKEELGKQGIQITNGEAAPNSPLPKTESREEMLEKIEKPTPTPVIPTAPKITLPEIEEKPHPLLAEKLSGPMQIPTSKTVHSLDNLTKPAAPAVAGAIKPPAPAPQKYDVDPYREPAE